MSGIIEVVNRRLYPQTEYIGRPSPLGNPYVIGRDGNRDQVCDRYEEWFAVQIRAKNLMVVSELLRLYDLMQIHDVVLLGCYCRPKNRCHGDTIQAFLMRNEDLLSMWKESYHIDFRFL